MMKRCIRVGIVLCMVTVLLSVLSLKTIEAKATSFHASVDQCKAILLAYQIAIDETQAGQLKKRVAVSCHFHDMKYGGFDLHLISSTSALNPSLSAFVFSRFFLGEAFFGRAGF
jgi:hypothetical protein